MNDDLSIIQDQIESRGEASRLCYPGDYVVVYTSTFAYRGTVTEVSPMVIVIRDPEILLPVGDHQARQAGSKEWPGLNAEPFAHSELRIPAFGVAVFRLS